MLEAKWHFVEHIAHIQEQWRGTPLRGLRGMKGRVSRCDAYQRKEVAAHPLVPTLIVE
jgi:hypothetical protein